MENTQDYQELINNLSNPDKIKEAKSKKVDFKETYKNLKEYYHKISHNDYYAAKAKLDQNVELKKNIREEIQKLELLKDKATLTDEEAAEISRINLILENQNKIPEIEKVLTEKITEIENQLRELKILMTK